ncbi:MAG: NADH-quinone oxidoreductase subunit J [Candidatus Kariarchaeaceae archaeon]|jgi:NADH:ubiquinone oxidoreductase subunit 6 (subunit J)
MDYVILILFSTAIISAFLSLESEKRINSLAFMVFSTSLIGILFLYAGALYAGVFQLLVYSGVLTVLFAATSYFLETEPVSPDTIGSVEVGLE